MSLVRARRALPALLVLAASCDEPTLEPRVSVRATSRIYAPGSPVALQIHNPTDRAVEIDPCAGELHGWPVRGYGGPPAHTIARACVTGAQPLRVEPGDARADTIWLGPLTPPAFYRAVLDVRDEGGRALHADERTSGVFEVKVPPARP